MKSNKRVKEAPSAMAITSPEKRRIMSELVVARNTIKNKFQQAYSNRMKLERATKEIFKPITSSITALKLDEKKEENKKKSKKKTRRRNLDESFDDFDLSDGISETRSFKPSRHAAVSTPKGILQPEFKSFSDHDEHKSTHRSGSELFHSMNNLTDLESTLQQQQQQLPSVESIAKSEVGAEQSFLQSPPRKNKTTPQSSPKSIKSSSPLKSPRPSPARTRHKFQLSGNIDATRNTYEACGDNDDKSNYNKYPDDDVMVQCIETSNLSGKTNRIDVEFKFLPQYAKKKWVEERKRMVSPLSSSDEEEKGAYSLTSKKKKNAKKGEGMKSINFDFIPYNANSRVVYEYFDDPNELCERLRLLVSSRMAGNTNHMQEINSIVEELRELGCIA